MDYIHQARVFLERMWEHMKDNHPRTCYKDGCYITRLGYGFPGEDKISCNDHYREMEGMQPQVNKCVYKGCDKRGHHRIGNTRYRFCAPHREELIALGLPAKSVNKNKGARKCIVDICDITASCDNKTRCKTHSLTGKSDDRRRCNFPGCTSNQRPSFGYEGKKKTRCLEHKQEGMVSRKICQQESCSISASFGLEGSVATHCKNHAPDGAYLVNAKTCAHESCNKQPIFGEMGTKKPTHCKAHAPAGHVDVKNKRCTTPECDKLCVDSTAFCVAHGGGKKCPMECCMYGGPRPQYRHPDNMSWICAFAARVLMENAYMNNDNDRVRMLMEHFGRKSIMVLNQQSAFRTEIEKRYWPKLQSCCDILFDASVSAKPKSLNDFRPDIFYKWCVDGVGFGIHIEYDEGRGHEDDDTRLEWIARSAGVEGRVYVIRVRDSTSEGNLCDRRQHGGVVYYEMNAVGRSVAGKVANAVMERIDWIQAGLGPDDAAGRRYKLKNEDIM